MPIDSTENIRIIVVDDHEIVRQGLVSLLNTEPGLSVVAVAGNGQQAVEAFVEHQPDITLMDLRLPVMGGVAATQAIRRQFPTARIIVLTTYDGDEDIYRALQAGAQSYLLKGVSFDELLATIRSVNGGARRIPAAVAEKLAERMPGQELTKREAQVLALIVKGNSNLDIATALGISEATVKSHVNSLLAKLGVSDRTQAATTALQRGLVHLD
jgi:DNA-binding NarL/FixJ family response regulator